MIATPQIQQRMAAASYQAPRYIRCADSAKLLRKALKRAFPGVTFRVRSDRTSIRVSWTDGPRPGRVDAVCGAFHGADFDGMIDMESSRYQWLMPDGSVQLARVFGTEGSRGTIPSSTHAKPHDNAELVHLGSKYVFTERSYSRRMLEKAAQVVACTYGCEAAEVAETAGGNMWYPSGHSIRPFRYDTATFSDLAYRALYEQNGPLV